MRAACRRRGGTAGASRASRHGGAPAPWPRAGPGPRMPEEVPQPAHPQRGRGRARRGGVPHRRPRCRTATPAATRDRWRLRQRARWRPVPLACGSTGSRPAPVEADVLSTRVPPPRGAGRGPHTRGAEHVPEDHPMVSKPSANPSSNPANGIQSRQPCRSRRFCECDAHIVDCGGRIPQGLRDRPENLRERCAHGRRDLPGRGEIDPRPALGLDGVEQRGLRSHRPRSTTARACGSSVSARCRQATTGTAPACSSTASVCTAVAASVAPRLRLSRHATRPHHHGCTSSMSSRSPAITSRPAGGCDGYLRVPDRDGGRW